MKTHHWVGATLSMKNLFGVVPSGIYGWPKNVLHWVGIEESIVDLHAAFRHHFAIVDGIVGMEGNGPIQGTAKHVGVLVAGGDPVAVDATCCRIMGIDPMRIRYLQLAARTRSIDIVRSESARSERTIRFACGGGTIDSPEEEIIAATASDDIRRLLDFLPETERAPVELAYFRSMTYRSVATHLGLPEGTVKSRIRAGLSRLRELGVVGMASDG